MSDPDVIVAGGGIGGLSTAYALARAGLTVRVVERAPAFTEVGAGLQLAPNATRILAGWGLLDRALDAGVRPRNLVFRDALDGTVLSRVPLGDEFVRRYGAPYLVIHRSDLLDILVAGCRDAGVDLVPDCEVLGVSQEGDRVVVKTGRGEVHAAAAIAADGLHSTLRRQVSDDEPVNSGFVAYRGAFTLAELDPAQVPDGLDEVTAYFGPDCHLVQYALRKGEVLNTVAVFRSPSYADGVASWGGADELDAAFAGGCPAVQRGVRLLWRDRRWPMYDRLPIDTWVDGRLALTGDAAHPMLQYLAQGACQAIEDARCLAAEVTRAGRDGCVDWPAALRGYQEQRVPRTGRVQRSARVWGDMWHVRDVSRLLRNELFRRRAAADYTDADWLYVPV
jgi:salicylate hydroxylase